VEVGIIPCACPPGLRGFAPIGMLEGWNYGIMGYGKLEWWTNGEIHLDKKLRDL